MIRTLLATTAIAAVMATSAIAQDTTKNPDDLATGRMIFNQENQSRMESKDGFFEASQGQILASSIVGQTVYNNSSEDAESVGDVNDVVMSQAGNAEAVIIGVGGFLGIGEKEVAVDFDELSWYDRDGQRWLVLDTSREALEAAPEFDRTALYPEQPKMDTAALPADKSADGNEYADVDAEQAATADKSEMAATDATDETNATDKNVKVAENAESEANKQVDATADTTAENKMEVDKTDKTASISRDDMSSVALDTISADDLIGTTVYGANDNNIGEIGDVLISAEGKFEAYIVDVGGFLGMGEKPVALDASELDILKDANGNFTIYTSLTEEQLDNHQAYSEESWASNRDEVILR